MPDQAPCQAHSSTRSSEPALEISSTSDTSTSDTSPDKVRAGSAPGHEPSPDKVRAGSAPGHEPSPDKVRAKVVYNCPALYAHTHLPMLMRRLPMWRRPTTEALLLGWEFPVPRCQPLGTYMRSAGSTLSPDPRTRPAHWRDPAHEPVHDHYPPMYGLGAHPVLHNTSDTDLRLLLRAGGTWVIDHVYEAISTGADPDTGRALRDPSTGRLLGRWTGVRWEDVAVALLRRAHGRFTSEGWAKDTGSPQDVDLDAPGGGAWPWEWGGWAFERKPSRR